MTVDGPFPQICRSILTKFVDVFLSRNPAVYIPSFLKSIQGCGRCSSCTQLHEFICDPNRALKEYQAAQKYRTHVEKQLTDANVASFGLKWTTSHVGNPHTLKITKPDRFTIAGAFEFNRALAQKALDATGDAGAQEKFFGFDLERIRAAVASSTSTAGAVSSKRLAMFADEGPPEKRQAMEK